MEDVKKDETIEDITDIEVELPNEDEATFVEPIEGTDVPTRIEWKSYE